MRAISLFLKICKVLGILIIIGLSLLPYSLADLSDRLQAYYKADNESSFPDATGIQVNGTVVGSTFVVSGKINGGYDCEQDASQYINLGPGFKADYTQMAYGGWIKPESTNANDFLFDAHNGANQGFFLRIDSGTVTCAFGYGTAESSVTTAINISVYSHIVCNWDGTDLKIYRNNFMAQSTGASANYNPNTDNTSLCRYPGGGLYYDGSFDEIFFYNRSLTVGEISQLYNSGVGLQYPFYQGSSLVINTDMANESNIGHDTATKKVSYNGTIIESDNLWNCSLLDNNTVINQSLNVNLSINQNFNVSFGEVEKDFLLKIDCNNSDTQDSTTVYRYRVDRVIPVIKSSIVNNSNYTQDDTLSWAWNCTDTNVGWTNSSLKDINGNVVFNRFNNASAGSIFMSNSSSYILTSATTYTYELTCWDSHTARQVKPIQWFFTGPDLFVEGINISGDFKELDGQGNDATYFVLDPRGDRYKLKVTFDDQALSHTLKIAGPELVYLPRSAYKGHFILWAKERWLDFQGSNVKAVTVTGNNPYTLVVEHYTATDEIEFESIGDLNRVNSVWSINVLSEEEQQTNYLISIDNKLGDIIEVIDLIPIIMLYAVFMAIGYWMILTGNTFSGWIMFAISLGFDFLLSGLLYTKYLPLADIRTGFQGAMVVIFIVFMFLWIVAKLLAFVSLQQRVQIR